jgi:hypothetical protein
LRPSPENTESVLSLIGVKYQEFAARVEDLDFPGVLGKLSTIRQAVTDWWG